MCTFFMPNLDEVRQYFGEGVAFYFAFLEMLTWALVFPSILGLIQLFLPYDFTTRSALCVIFLLWAFGLMEVIRMHIFLYNNFKNSVILKKRCFME